MLQALVLLTMALQLLVAANGPGIPESLKQQAISIANFAIKVSNEALKGSSVASISSAVTSPAPVTVVPPPAPPTDATSPSTALTPSPVPPPPPQVIYVPVPVSVSPPPPPPPSPVAVIPPLPPPPPTKIEFSHASISNPTQNSVFIKSVTYEIGHLLCPKKTDPITIPLQFWGHKDNEDNHLIATSSVVLTFFCSVKTSEKIILTVPFNISLNSGERIFIEQYGAFSEIIAAFVKRDGVKNSSNPEQFINTLGIGSFLGVRLKDLVIEPQSVNPFSASDFVSGRIGIYAYSK